MISYKQVSVSDIQVKNPALPLKESEIERITKYLSISKTAFPPLVVKRLGSRLSCHTYELLTGYQQYYAAQKAKLNRINALILEENDTPEIEAAILNQIQPNSPISEVMEDQKQEKVAESSVLNSPAKNSNEDIIKMVLEQNQQILEQNNIIRQSLEEMKAALAKINAKIDSLPPSQVSLPMPTATPSTFSEDQNQLELKLRLLNKGTDAQLEEWFKKAGFDKRTRERHLKKILNYRSQNHFKSLEELVRCLSIKSSSLKKLKDCPVPTSFAR